MSSLASQQAEGGPGDQYLTFLLGGEEYCVPILRVQEIRGWQGATPVPSAPPFLRGVINLRGRIVPVLDLRRLMGADAVEYGRSAVVIVLCGEGAAQGRIGGLLVDAVSDVRTIGEGEIRPAPEIAREETSRLTDGFASVDDGLIVLLAVDRILDATGSLEAGPGVGPEVESAR